MTRAPLPIRTPERDALLRAEWPAGVASLAILGRFNALPGRGVDLASLCHLANVLRLRRPVGFWGPTAPDTLAEALAATAQAEARKFRRQALLSDPVLASYERVARWAAEQRIVFTQWDDLRRVNDRRECVGLPVFRRVLGERVRA